MVNEFEDLQLPCSDPELMDDWFIAERSPLPPEEEEDIRTLAATQARMDHGDRCTPEIERRAADRAVDDAVRDLKARRRRAMAACYSDCPMSARLRCLNEGLQPMNLDYGIWGGYPESDRKAIRRGIDERERTMTTGAAARIVISAEHAAATRGELLEEDGGALNRS